jgi:hypothetical protein
MRGALPIVLLLAAAACSDASSDANQPAVRDSAGVAIVEHTAEGWERAPAWALSAAPIAVMPRDDDDGSIDLSNSQLGTMLADGRVVAATMPPTPQIYLFSADGSTVTPLGRGGEGPGEYQFLTALFPVGSDSVIGYDMMKRRAVIFNGAGEAFDPIEFPMNNLPIPPILVGRLADGTWLFQSFNPMAAPPAGETGVYRSDMPVLTWRAGAEKYDTVFTLLGPMLKQGTVSAGGQSMTMGRGIGFGANSFVGGSGDMMWSTTGDRFQVAGYDASGALKRQIRVALPIRPVLEPDRERFKTVLREQLQRFATMMPPGMLDSELAKVEETPFADNQPAIGQMLVDRLGRIWVTPNTPMVDSTATWGVFDPEGTLLGKVVVPAGTLYAASEDRVVIRREDDETGLIRLEVWGLQRDQ